MPMLWIFWRGLLQFQPYEDALKLFDEAVESGIANIFTFNNLLYWLCKVGKMSEASGLWDKMISKGMTPNITSYSNFILGHCRKGAMDVADGLFAEMLERGLKPNVVTYSILMDGHFKKGQAERAAEIFGQMMAEN